MTTDPIDALRSQPQPPEALERRVVNAVSLSGVRRHRSRHRLWLAGVAAALLFVAGIGVGRSWTFPAQTTDTAANGGARYLLLLAGEVSPASDGGTRAAEYGAWARAVSGAGVFVRGAELDPAAHLIGARPDTSLARELATVGGYFIIEAASDADAMRLAESCPHVKYGGVIQVRKLL